MAPFLFIQRHGEHGYMIGLARHQEILRCVQNPRMAEDSQHHFCNRDKLITYFRDAVAFSPEGMESLCNGLNGISPEQSISHAMISDEDCKRILEKGFDARTS